MKKPEEILENAIKEYNSTVNNINKFKLNKDEIKMFVNCMKQYSNQSLDEAANNLTQEFISPSYYESECHKIYSLKDDLSIQPNDKDRV